MDILVLLPIGRAGSFRQRHRVTVPALDAAGAATDPGANFAVLAAATPLEGTAPHHHAYRHAEDSEQDDQETQDE